MSSVCEPRHRSDFGTYAFACVVVACFTEFAFAKRIEGTITQFVATFVMGALYATLGVLENSIVARWGERCIRPIFAVLCALATALLYVSPLRGFFGIIALPMPAWAILSLPLLPALLVTLYFYAACVGVVAYYYGIVHVPESSLSYLAAFAFTVAFTINTQRAIASRERAETLTRELEDANRQLREHAAQAGELATTRERNRVAREIHDGVGHYLTVVKTQLDAAAALLPARPEESRAAIVKAAKLSAEALDDVRRSVGALRTDTARPPLPEALRELAALGAPAASVAIAGTPRPLSPAIEHALFRAAQEGLTNIRRHARASSAELTLDFRAAALVQLIVSDDGIGDRAVPDAANAGRTGFGLIGLRERIELLGGRVAAGPRPGGGFSLRVEIPA